MLGRLSAKVKSRVQPIGEDVSAVCVGQVCLEGGPWLDGSARQTYLVFSAGRVLEYNPGVTVSAWVAGLAAVSGMLAALCIGTSRAV